MFASPLSTFFIEQCDNKCMPPVTLTLTPPYNRFVLPKSKGHTWPCTIIHRRHVHPDRHRVNTTIAPLCCWWWPPGAKNASQVRQSGGHSRSPAQKRGTACQSTSGHLTPSLPSRTVSRHICLNCRTVSRSDDFDVDRRPCSDSSHVTAPYKLALYYYFIIIQHL